MKNIIILILIIFYWFVLSTVLTYMFQDEFLSSALIEGNETYDIEINTTFMNITSGQPSGVGQSTPISFLSMTGRIFTMRIPFIDSQINFIISFINWLMILVLAIVIYRLVSPATGG